MKKNLLLCLISLLLGTTTIFSQKIVQSPDLLDVKFLIKEKSAQAIDESLMNFTINKGSVSPIVEYDSKIKQYVSQFRTNSPYQFFSFNYKDNTDFKNKLRNDYTIELYTKNQTSRMSVPFSSTQYGGLGVSQNESPYGGNCLWHQDSKTNMYAIFGASDNYYSTNTTYDHIVFTYDQANKKLSYYLNGKLISTKLNISSVKLADAAYHSFFIGGDVSATPNKAENMYFGNIASVRMYSKALTNDDVNSLYNLVLNRSLLNGADNLNNIIATQIPEYIDKQADENKRKQANGYLKEGWKLMNSLNTTQNEIQSYLTKVKVDLNIDATIKDKRELPRFAVISDVHISADNRYSSSDKLQKTIDILNQQKDDLDALFIVGDLTDTYSTTEYNKALEKLNLLAPNINIYSLMGNHEYYTQNQSSLVAIGNFKNYFGALNKVIDIKGYPFIIISASPYDTKRNEHYSKETLSFVSNALAKASTDYPDKPIFVYAHVAAYKTVLGSNDGDLGTGSYFYSKELDQILKNYEQVVLFSGHIHSSIVDERSIFQNNYSSINIGTQAYACHVNILDNKKLNDNYDGVNGIVKDNTAPSEAEKVAEGIIVEVKPDKNIKIERWDFNRNIKIKPETPWIINYPYTKNNFVYTSERNGGEAPYFIEGSQVSYVNGGVKFPQALDDDMVDYYNIKVMSGNYLSQDLYISSKYYLNTDMPKELWFRANANSKYIVTAVDSYGSKSESLAGGTTTKYPLYLIGTATTAGWNNIKPIPMKEDEDGVFIWEGYLQKGSFKFLTEVGKWYSLTTTKGYNEVVNLDTEYKISASYVYSTFRNQTFLTQESGYYIVKVDVINQTMTLSRSAQNVITTKSLTDNLSSLYKITSNDHSIHINADGILNSISIWDTNGRLVFFNQNKTGVISINNLNNGVYIVQIESLGKKDITKVVIK